MKFKITMFLLSAAAAVFLLLAVTAAGVHAAIPGAGTPVAKDTPNESWARPIGYTDDCWVSYSVPVIYKLAGVKTFEVTFRHKACARNGNVTCCAPSNITAHATIWDAGEHLGWGFDGDYSWAAFLWSGIGQDNEKWYPLNGKAHAVHRTVKLVRFSTCSAPTPIGCGGRDLIYVLGTFTDHAWGWGPKSRPWTRAVWRDFTNPDLFARKARWRKPWASVTRLPIHSGDYR